MVALEKDQNLHNLGSLDVSFSTQMNTELGVIIDMPDLVDSVKQFVDILIDIKMDWIINQEK